ncbi:MAG: hypothetical protein ACK4WB_08495, partial [Desulfatiglandales bacterium]
MVVVEEGKNRLKAYEIAKENATDPVDLVEYGHKISYTTAGPVGYQSGQPVAIFHPPAPQEVEIRSGLLYTKINIPGLNTAE